jgi:hypothetical protein
LGVVVFLRDHRGYWIKGFAKNIGTTSAFNAELWGPTMIYALRVEVVSPI